MISIRRLTGMGVAGCIALALLGGGCVLAATGGPRQAQATSIRSLNQTLTGKSPISKVLVASAPWSQVVADVQPSGPPLTGPNNLSLTGRPTQYLTAADLADVTSQLHGDFNQGALRMAPSSQDWAWLTSSLRTLSVPAQLAGYPAALEVSYRQPESQYLRVVAGTMADGPAEPQVVPDPGRTTTLLLQVVATEQTAKTFGLRPGSTLLVAGPQLLSTGVQALVELDVTGIVSTIDPGSSFWTVDPTLAAPEIVNAPGRPPFWAGGFIAGPDEAPVLQRYFGAQSMTVQWTLPIDTSHVNGQAQALASALNQAMDQAPSITGPMGPLASVMTISSGLAPLLHAYIQAAAAVNVLLWLVYVSLAVAAMVVLLLAAWMVAARRTEEFALRRARGASLWHLFLLGAGGAALGCIPAAAVAWLLAVLLIPNAAPAGSSAWWPGLATLGIAVAAPGAMAAWQHRFRRRTRGRWAPRRGLRLVIEATACAAAVAGIILARRQVPQAGSGIDLFTSAAPVLIAIPAVIIAARVYPTVLRILARTVVGRRGVSGFVGLARAASTAGRLAMPALALVLALIITAFTGMVHDAILRAETAVSWQSAGADVTIAPTGAAAVSVGVSPAAARAITAVPGVAHSATSSQFTWTTSDRQQVTGIAVDPAAYAALVASAEGFPLFPASAIAPASAGAAQPVLASPQAIADFAGQRTVTLTAGYGLAPLRARIAGEIAATPALPSGGAFIIMPVSVLHGYNGGGQPPANMIMLTGSSIDMTRLTAVLHQYLSSPPQVTTRAGVLNGLTQAPLQQGTFTLFTIAAIFSGCLALAVLLLELALGAADREVTLARLATMGLGARQRALLLLLEVLPAVVATAVATVASALALPTVLAPAINLSVFTQSAQNASLQVDLVSVGLPLIGLFVVAVLAVGWEIRAHRRHGVAATFRADT